MAKRAFDLLCSSVGLVVLSPLLLAVALAVRMDSAGPVFFRQTRVGQGGRHFRIHKFRTMFVANNRGSSQITVGRDPRITRIGHILRRYKIDELPQLLDVLRGKMSIVGPRPEVPKYVAFYPETVKDEILSVRPGITDQSSIMFVDEAELLARQADPERYYVEEILPIKNRHHLEYARSHSVLGDIGIILTTLRRIVA